MPSYAKWFRTPEAAADHLEEIEQSQQAEFRRTVAAAAPFIEAYKSRLIKRSRVSRWKEGMTQEQAAANLIAQTVLLEQIEELDRMVRDAKESSDGG